MARKNKSKIVHRKNNLRKHKKKNIKNSHTWKQNIFILAVVFFIGTVGYIFLCSDLLVVHKFDIRGVNRVNKDQIIDIIKYDINGKIISCIKKNNYFIIDKNKISKDILKNDRLKKVNIIKRFPDKIIVEIQEYDNLVIWCKSSAMEACFLVDGEIVKKQVSMDNSVVVNNRHFVIVDDTHQDISIGDHVMSEEFLKKIEILGRELVYMLDVKIEQPFKVTSRGSYEVRFMTDEGWYIIIDLSQETKEILDIAKLFATKVDLPSRRSDLEYVDMRFPEKIFYKMKDGVEQNVGQNEKVKNDKSGSKNKSKNKK